jgi:hypothetical protein
MNEFLYEEDVIGKLSYLLSLMFLIYILFSLLCLSFLLVALCCFPRESNLSDLRVVSFFLLKHGNNSSNSAIVVVNPMTATLPPSAPPLAMIEQQQTIPIVIATPAPFECHDSSYYHHPDIERPSAPLLGSDGKSDSLSNATGKKG